MRTNGRDKLPVCIIGAGVAGLAAGHALHQNSIPFVIVEGASRIGGRVFPFRHKNQTLQHGATFVNGEENGIYEIARDHDLINESVGDFDLFADFNEVHTESEHVTESDKAEFTEFVKRLEENYAEIAKSNEKRTLKEAFNADYDTFILGCPSRVNRKESFDSLAQFYLSYYEMEWAADPEKMALANFSRWDDESDVGDRSYTLKGDGYGKILDVMKKRIPEEKIMLNMTVTKISHGVDSVTVSFSNKTQQEFEAVIVTSSLGFLKKHASSFFEPSLPERKMKAIEAIGFGDMQKMFLEWDKPFWTEEQHSIKTIGKPESPMLRRGNLFETVEIDPKMLTMWLSGPAVESASIMPEYHIKKMMAEHFRNALKDDSIEAPARIRGHCWRDDRFHLGSYSYLTPAAVEMGDANGILAEPILSTEGRPLVCFAGEATHSSLYQTTSGAFLSGEREAGRFVSMR